MFTAAAYHESGNILQKHEWNFFLITIKDKPGCFVGTVIIYNAAHLHFTLPAFYNFSLVGNDAHSPSINSSITANDSFSVILFKLVKLGIVNKSLDHFHHIIGLGTVGWYQAAQIVLGFSGFF